MVQPENLANLIIILSNHIFTLLPSPLFPTSSTNISPQDPTREALNCLRVLGRVLVVVYEAEADAVDQATLTGESSERFARKYLWSRTPVVADPASNNPGQFAETRAEEEADGQFKIEDSDSEDEEDAGAGTLDEGARAFKATIENPPRAPNDTSALQQVESMEDPLTKKDEDADGDWEAEEPTLPCLIDRLFSCTIDLLFCAGFTVPGSVRSQSGSDEKVNVSVSFSRSFASTPVD